MGFESDIRRALAAAWTTGAVALAGVAPAQAQGALQAIDPAALQATMAGMAAEMLVPGVVTLLRTPQGEVILTHGVAQIGETAPIISDMHFRIGSNTKTMTGTVILQLVEEGKLALEDPVSKYRPEVPDGDGITIAQLLNMRSGLFNYTTTFAMNRLLDDQPLKAWDPEDLAALGLRYPPYFAPDQGYRYSNTNTVLLGLIAEQIDGKPLETIFQDRIFAPLGLDDTLLPARGVNGLPEPHAHGYMYTDNVMTIASNAIPADLLFDAKAGTFTPKDQTNANPSWGWAAGAGISTAADLANYVEALVDGRLLSPEMQKIRMDSLRPTSDNPSAARYGYALAQFGPMYGHTGELPGYNTFMGRDPVNRVTLIVWANLAPAPDGRDPATTIAREMLGQIYAAAP